MSDLDSRVLVAVIGDSDTITGFLLAGTGDSQKRNYFTSDGLDIPKLESKFKEFITRNDIAVVLINQHLANLIRPAVDGHLTPFPAVLEIPSKDHQYDPAKDSILKRVSRLF